jgi:quinol monooxygenase YgiN
MAILFIEYRVTDFAGWKRVFDQDPLRRSEHGVTTHTLYRDPDDPDHFLLSMRFRSVDEAKRFRDLPAFQQVWEVSGAGASWVLEEGEAVTF